MLMSSLSAWFLCFMFCFYFLHLEFFFFHRLCPLLSMRTLVMEPGWIVVYGHESIKSWHDNALLKMFSLPCQVVKNCS